MSSCCSKSWAALSSSDFARTKELLLAVKLAGVLTQASTDESSRRVLSGVSSLVLSVLITSSKVLESKS